MSKDSPSRLYIGNLSRDVKEKDLEALFEPKGAIRSIDIKQGFGFVHFKERKDAEAALKDLDGEKLLGKAIQVQGSKGARDFSRETCYNCGKTGHWARDCTAADWSDKCYNCGERDHKAKDCPRGGMRRRSRSPRGRRRSRSPYGRGRDPSPPSRRYSRDRSPPRGYRRRSLSPRRRSPPRRRSRSPPPRRYDDRDRPRYDDRDRDRDYRRDDRDRDYRRDDRYADRHRYDRRDDRRYEERRDRR